VETACETVVPRPHHRIRPVSSSAAGLTAAMYGSKPSRHGATPIRCRGLPVHRAASTPQSAASASTGLRELSDGRHVRCFLFVDSAKAEG
jgi:hypothetical protein